MTVRHPPGRAGRLWLVARLEVARGAASVLQRKEQVLRSEEQRLAHVTAETAAAWAATVGEAEADHRRAMILGGRPALERTAASAGSATVGVAWRSTIGVELPAEATCMLPAAVAATGTSAIDAAASAYRRALTAGVAHAAAVTAHERVRRDIEVTGQRLHAVRDRWIPRLLATLRELEVRLDEHEREELMRTRRAARATAGARL
jgi:V/A-type H+-transporting ATPase subunit D